MEMLRNKESYMTCKIKKKACKNKFPNKKPKQAKQSNIQIRFFKMAYQLKEVFFLNKQERQNQSRENYQMQYELN